jgi:F-type H+-transporting ATPase subunit b
MTRTDRLPRPSGGGARRAGLGSLLGILAAAAPALAAEAGGGSGLGIEVNATLLIQVVNFLLLLAVLYRFLFKPLMGALEGRSAAIRQQLAEAQAAREEAQRQLAAFDARLREAQAEAQQVRERALREAAQLSERLTAEARAEAARVVETAQAQVAQEVRRARTELRAEVGTLATEVAERLIRKSLRDEDHQRIVQEALARVSS